MNSQFTDYTNQRFGIMTASWPAGRIGKRVGWLCFCDCGNFFVARSSNLSGNRTKSCGCTRKQKFTTLTHGHSPRSGQSPEYRTWANMIQRCANLDDIYYGGRGIKVCDRWLNSFEAFIEDMGARPEGQHGLRSEYSIDRRNVDGNYEPCNCYWATVDEQSVNKRPRR